MKLFKERGWEAGNAGDLVGIALCMTSLVVGLVLVGVGILFAEQTTWWKSSLLHWMLKIQTENKLL